MNALHLGNAVVCLDTEYAHCVNFEISHVDLRLGEGNASYGGKRIDGQDAVMQAGDWEGTGLTGSVSRCLPYTEEGWWGMVSGFVDVLNVGHGRSDRFSAMRRRVQCWEWDAGSVSLQQTCSVKLSDRNLANSLHRQTFITTSLVSYPWTPRNPAI